MEDERGEFTRNPTKKDVKMISSDVCTLVNSYHHFARYSSMSFKKTHGFKIFGEEWAVIHSLNLESLCRRYEENQMLKRILHIERKISMERDFDSEVGYNLILDDLRVRLRILFQEHKTLNCLIVDSLEELMKKRGINSLVVP